MFRCLIHWKLDNFKSSTRCIGRFEPNSSSNEGIHRIFTDWWHAAGNLGFTSWVGYSDTEFKTSGLADCCLLTVSNASVERENSRGEQIMSAAPATKPPALEAKLFHRSFSKKLPRLWNESVKTQIFQAYHNVNSRNNVTEDTNISSFMDWDADWSIKNMSTFSLLTQSTLLLLTFTYFWLWKQLFTYFFTLLTCPSEIKFYSLLALTRSQAAVKPLILLFLLTFFLLHSLSLSLFDTQSFFTQFFYLLFPGVYALTCR